MGTKSALGNKRQLTNQIAGKDGSRFPPFFKKTHSNHAKTQMDVWSEHLLSNKMDMLQNMVVYFTRSKLLVIFVFESLNNLPALNSPPRAWAMH